MNIFTSEGWSGEIKPVSTTRLVLFILSFCLWFQIFWHFLPLLLQKETFIVYRLIMATGMFVAIISVQSYLLQSKRWAAFSLVGLGILAVSTWLLIPLFGLLSFGRMLSFSLFVAGSLLLMHGLQAASTTASRKRKIYFTLLATFGALVSVGWLFAGESVLILSAAGITYSSSFGAGIRYFLTAR